MKYTSLLFLLPLISCVTATVNEPNVCSTASLGTFPGSPVAVVAPPPASYTTPENFSDTLQKINDVTSDYSVNVTELMLTSKDDLSWISTVQVYVKGDSSQPRTLLATYQQSTPGALTSDGLNMQVVMDSNALVAYLHTPVTLTFQVVASKAPTSTTTLGAAFCVSADASLSKSL